MSAEVRRRDPLANEESLGMSVVHFVQDSVRPLSFQR